MRQGSRSTTDTSGNTTWSLVIIYSCITPVFWVRSRDAWTVHKGSCRDRTTTWQREHGVWKSLIRDLKKRGHSLTKNMTPSGGPWKGSISFTPSYPSALPLRRLIGDSILARKFSVVIPRPWLAHSLSHPLQWPYINPSTSQHRKNGLTLQGTMSCACAPQWGSFFGWLVVSSFQPWRWRQHVSPKRWHLPMSLYGAKT
jgi:hypothetical protein